MISKLFIVLVTLVSVCSCVNDSSDKNVLDSKLHVTLTDERLVTFDPYLIYVYSPTCVHCNNIKDYVVYYQNNKTLDIYYLNAYIIDLDIDDKSNIGISIEYLESIKGTPTLLYIREMIIKDEIIGSSEISSYLIEIS